jgi:hypothetical protein
MVKNALGLLMAISKRHNVNLEGRGFWYAVQMRRALTLTIEIEKPISAHKLFSFEPSGLAMACVMATTLLIRRHSVTFSPPVE